MDFWSKKVMVYSNFAELVVYLHRYGRYVYVLVIYKLLQVSHEMFSHIYTYSQESTLKNPMYHSHKTIFFVLCLIGFICAKYWLKFFINGYKIQRLINHDVLSVFSCKLLQMCRVYTTFTQEWFLQLYFADVSYICFIILLLFSVTIYSSSFQEFM